MNMMTVPRVLPLTLLLLTLLQHLSRVTVIDGFIPTSKMIGIPNMSPSFLSTSTSSLYMSSISTSQPRTSSVQIIEESASAVPSSLPSGTTTTTSTNNSNQYNAANQYKVMTNNIQPWMELPVSSGMKLRRQQQQQLEVLEQVIGRIAMIGAIGIAFHEIYDGQSIIEQITTSF